MAAPNTTKEIMMPIHKAKGPKGGKGYQWGGSGKIYPTKKQALAQARAAYAAGYKKKNSK